MIFATLLSLVGAAATLAQSTGPVAAYAFDAGSGATVVDVTSHNNTISLLNGPTWRAGKYGNAVAFDATNDLGVAGAAQPALNLTGRSFTLSAWINPRSNSGWQMIVNKPYTAGHAAPYFDWSMHRENSTGRLVAFLGCEAVQRPSNSSVPLNVWTHVAVTYDGGTLRHYINGVLDRTTSVSCAVTNTNSRPIRIGANGTGSEVMNGAIDDVRIYNRPLSAAEVQTDMATALGSVSTPPDSAAPSVTLTAPANGATVSGTVTITANASDDVAVIGVRFRVDGVNITAEDQSAPFAAAWNTTELSNGNHTITASARDAAGNTTNSSVVTVNVSNSSTPPGSGGPVAAYSFNASSGTTVTDVSGNANTLHLVNGPLWGGGHSGNAVSFDGTNDYAVAAAANSALNLTGHNFTLSAWVNPRANNSTWQMIVNKPATVGHSWPYFDWSMHRENPSGRLVAWLGCDGTQRASNSSIALNTWTHVAVTYDGAALRHFINGVLDRSTPVSCSITNANSRPIRIGANGSGTEIMNGLVDDVRIYSRTLLTAEIRADMGTPLSGGGTPSDSSAPTVAVTAPANGASVSGTVNVAATASDNVGVVGVQFKVDGVSYGSEDQSAPYAVAWNSTQLSNGNHTLTATARDAAGNSRTSTAIAVNVNNAPSSPAPTVSLSANPGSVPSGGGSTLMWNSTNATSCVASGAWSGSKATSGSQSTGALNINRTYTLACSGTSGTTSRSVTVSVAAAAPEPTLTLSANPTSVASGGSASLNWSSSEATSCTASGAWSGSRPTSGSASTGALSNGSNLFTLVCSGPGGSINRSATVNVQSDGNISGLDFPGSAATSGTIRFRFRNPLAIYPATYIWRVHPRQQSGYYTTFFWGNDGPFWWDNGAPNTYYGAHPYPYPPPTGTPRWEIATDRGGDFLSNESVVFDRWYTQALRVWSDGSGKHHEFYWDLPNTSRVIRVDVGSSFANVNPPNPALTFGDAPWNPSNEIMNGVIRGIQIYATTLSLNDVLTESSNPLSTSAGSSNVWYLNLNPRPTDISDKSGRNHHPEWVGTERPRLWSGQ